jgi:hypothetical protein
MITNNRKFIKRDNDELPSMLTIDQSDEYYHLVLRADDHILLKSRLSWLELRMPEAEKELINYTKACKALGEEVTELRSKLQEEGEWKRKYNDLEAKHKSDTNTCLEAISAYVRKMGEPSK